MAVMDTSKVINGTWGSLILDGDEITEITAFQAKDEYQKEEVPRVGTMSKGYKISSVDGKGSATMNKVDSKMGRKIGKQVREGKTPKFTLIGGLVDPDAYGAERIAFYGVIFDDLTLMDWETGQFGKVECPFTYEGYEYLDMI